MAISRETRQKDILCAQVSLMHTFFSAQELFDKVFLLDSGVGKATVYRFLQRTRDAGSIHSFECGGVTVYSLTARMHCHFVCETCGDQEHFLLSDLPFLTREMQKRACHIQVSVDGVCKKCASNRITSV